MRRILHVILLTALVTTVLHAAGPAPAPEPPFDPEAIRNDPLGPQWKEFTLVVAFTGVALEGCELNVDRRVPHR